jgi:hypothetical protein
VRAVGAVGARGHRGPRRRTATTPTQHASSTSTSTSTSTRTKPASPAPESKPSTNKLAPLPLDRWRRGRCTYYARAASPACAAIEAWHRGRRPSRNSCWSLVAGRWALGPSGSQPTMPFSTGASTTTRPALTHAPVHQPCALCPFHTWPSLALPTAPSPPLPMPMPMPMPMLLPLPLPLPTLAPTQPLPVRPICRKTLHPSPPSSSPRRPLVER